MVTTALDLLARDLPVMPGEEDPCYMDARRADALVAMCSATLGSGAQADPDRATVVIHARAEGIDEGTGGCEIQGGPVIHPQTARRLACTGRIQRVVEDDTAQPLAVSPCPPIPPGG